MRVGVPGDIIFNVAKLILLIQHAAKAAPSQKQVREILKAMDNLETIVRKIGH